MELLRDLKCDPSCTGKVAGELASFRWQRVICFCWEAVPAVVAENALTKFLLMIYWIKWKCSGRSFEYSSAMALLVAKSYPAACNRSCRNDLYSLNVVGCLPIKKLCLILLRTRFSVQLPSSYYFGLQTLYMHTQQQQQHTHTHTHTHTHLHTHTYIHTQHTHTYIHTYMHTYPLSCAWHMHALTHMH